MSTRITAPLLAIWLASLPAEALLADNLLVEGIKNAQASAGERPSRGMSMAKVTAAWGEPTNKLSAVGQPPIARWDYPAFTVYFEYDHVIHAVIKRGA
jgi:hypothetical protein